MNTPPATAITARALSFRYRRSRRPALDGVDLDLPRGRWGLLLGPTGAGKSTLVHCINRSIPQFFHGDLSGSLDVWGEPTKDRRVPEMAARVGIVFQDFETQIFSTSCLLEVAFAMENRGLEAATIRKKASELLEKVGLAGFESRDPSTLSGGEKQRLVIASVLALEAPLLVLDEPASDLDPGGRDAVYRLIDSLAGETVLLIDHDLEGIPVTTTGALLQEGRVTRQWHDSTEQEMMTLATDLEMAGVRPPPIPRLLAALHGRHASFLTHQLTRVEELDVALTTQGWSLDPAAIALPPSRTRGGKPQLTCEGVSREYGNRTAVDDVDLSIEEGEFVALIGANGSGKTTLARLVAGLERPTRGHVRFRGKDVSGIPARQRAREIGFIFQNPDHQIFSATVREEIAFGPVNLGFEENDVARRVDEALEVAGLTSSAEEDPFALTKGERQRLALASVLACEPALIIMDEPTTGLDLGQQRKVMSLLGDLNRKGHTIVIITHALWLLREPIGRVLLMNSGRVVADGSPYEVLADGGLMAAAGLRMPDLARLAALRKVPLLTVSQWVAALVPPGGSG